MKDSTAGPSNRAQNEEFRAVVAAASKIRVRIGTWTIRADANALLFEPPSGLVNLQSPTTGHQAKSTLVEQTEFRDWLPRA